jgi:cellulase/cellobiase CelA1
VSSIWRRAWGHYANDFIDVIAAQFHDHSSQRIVAILEPDSLANLATNSTFRDVRRLTERIDRPLPTRSAN